MEAGEQDRVSIAYGIADQLFEGDLRARKPIEPDGERALDAWMRYAATSRNTGLWRVLEQLDRCAFSERWGRLRAAWTERGRIGVFELTQHNPVASERCDHKFVDSTNCLRCGVHVSALQAAQLVEARELDAGAS